MTLLLVINYIYTFIFTVRSQPEQLMDISCSQEAVENMEIDECPSLETAENLKTHHSTKFDEPHSDYNCSENIYQMKLQNPSLGYLLY